MAALTTDDLLRDLRAICDKSKIVSRIEERAIDTDTLSIRVHLSRPDTFVSVFYNLDTDKTSFALIEKEKRIYGVDNAKMGWHTHPFDDPAQHVSCDPITFGKFLESIETHYS